MLTEYELAIREAGIPLRESYSGFVYDYMELLLESASKGEVRKDVDRIDRTTFVKKYGFAIPSIEVLEGIKKVEPILEVGSGTGYWAYELKKIGCDIIATDIQVVNGKPHTDYGFHTKWTEIEQISGLDAVEKYSNRTLMICWPSYGENWAAKVIKKYKGEYLVYIGEWGDACGDDKMVKLLDTKFEEVESFRIPTWYGIHDACWILKRKVGK